MQSPCSPHAILMQSSCNPHASSCSPHAVLMQPMQSSCSPHAVLMRSSCSPHAVLMIHAHVHALMHPRAHVSCERSMLPQVRGAHHKDGITPNSNCAQTTQSTVHLKRSMHPMHLMPQPKSDWVEKVGKREHVNLEDEGVGSHKDHNAWSPSQIPVLPTIPSNDAEEKPLGA